MTGLTEGETALIGEKAKEGEVDAQGGGGGGGGGEKEEGGEEGEEKQDRESSVEKGMQAVVTRGEEEKKKGGGGQGESSTLGRLGIQQGAPTSLDPESLDDCSAYWDSLDPSPLDQRQVI
jgi:hypothetical protein